MTLEQTLDKRNATVLECTRVMVSDQEASLLDLIDKMKYGTIHNVEMISAEKTVRRFASPRRMALINFLRDGNQMIDEMVVHDGDVSYVNIIGVVPFRHVRKVKF